ncbi:MAG: phosphoribosylformylglycinamidine synthase subunit PurQ, partial [Eubacteriales bacterium]|nr:phosphoribosylformylglycinamidine synthase subunit PurQ [Eubacteriales bacterium]
GTELAISESQERMAVVVADCDVPTFLLYAAEENIEATVVARVTDNARLSMTWRGQRIVDLSREFLNSNGAPKHIDISVPDFDKASFLNTMQALDIKEDSSLEEIFSATVTDLNVCSQKGLIERFDSTIGASSILMPLGGIRQATPTQAMVAKLPVLSGKTTTCSIMSYGFDPFLSEADPFSGAYLAVVESLAKIVASGGSVKNAYLSFQEYFEKLGSDPLRWGKPFSALLGALKAQTELGVGAIGGKDSMSGSFESIHVPPTLVSFAVSYGNAANIISPEFKKAGSRIAFLSPLCDDTGLPLAESLSVCFNTVEDLVANKKVLSAYTLTKGGLAEALFKMTVGNQIGIALSCEPKASLLSQKAYGSFVLELSEDAELKENDMPYSVSILGTTVAEYTITRSSETMDLSILEQKYESKLSSVYPSDVADQKDAAAVHIPSLQFDADKVLGYQGLKANTHYAKPLALIPVFPGTNCEYDTARALAAAGAEPHITVIRNLSPESIADSIKEIAAQIARAQIIVLPGGFSGGDEPDGSGKFITAFFRNPLITERVREFLNQRDGLMLGICNGFQALIKLGLVPYGDIRDMDASCPTLTMNRIGRHQSRLVRTRVASNISPWLSTSAVGEIHTMPISHGEGRFVIEDSLLSELIAKGQIATQYVDLSGLPTSEIQYNPNGSLHAIEGITSPDGRILGKMGHSERHGEFVHKNVPGNMDQQLFENAVRYFSI